MIKCKRKKLNKKPKFSTIDLKSSMHLDNTLKLRNIEENKDKGNNNKTLFRSKNPRHTSSKLKTMHIFIRCPSISSKHVA